MSAKLPTGFGYQGLLPAMQARDLRTHDLFAHVQRLIDGFEVERKARQAAEAADKAKSELLATIGQELKTPTEAVVAMADLLLATPLDETQQRHTETLLQSSRSLLNVLNDVLDFSRLETGRFEADPIAFDLHGLVHEVAAELQARANDKGLTGSFYINANCPRFVICNAARLRQVLMGLIENSLKYTSIGSVRLHASATENDGRLMLRFDVVDTGVGLSKAVQDRLFQPCIEINNCLGEVTGLGLPIARKLAKLMGGDIGCRSVVGQGSLYWLTLTVELPRKTHAPSASEPTPASEPPAANEVPDAPDANEPAVASEVQEAPAASEVQAAPAAGEANDAVPQKLSGHVLVAEDNAVNRALIGTYLKEFGLSHEMVSSGSAAVMSVATKTYDLVLLDTMIPDLDGIETTRRIRGMHVPSAELPIVALVAHAKKQHCGTYLSAGMDACVMKPISAGELHAALAPFLTRAQQSEPMLRLVKA
jgi:signal transduction histidine kinase/CheY-like chemotaxis protein